MRELINLLLVDDNSDFLEIIHEMLEGENLSVRSVETVSGAEKVLQNSDIDAIICDFNLPDSNGIDFLRLLRKSGLPTPFILITGNITNEILLNALRLGAFDIIEKPIRFDCLCQVVSQAINSGIQYRNMNHRLKEKLVSEDYKLVSNNLKTISMLRSSNDCQMNRNSKVA